MNQVLLVFLISILWMPKNYAQDTFSKTFDLGGLELGWTVLVENDGFLISGGAAIDTPLSHLELVLLKIDFDGEILWDKKIGGDSFNLYPGYSGSLLKTSDLGYVQGGGWENIADDDDALLIKYDQYGDTVFTRKYGKFGIFDQAVDAVETPDGGYAIFGETRSYGAGQSDFYLVKTDSAGDFQWQKTYGVVPMTEV